MSRGWARWCGTSAGQDSCWLVNQNTSVSLMENRLLSHHTSVSMSLTRPSLFPYRISDNPYILSVFILHSVYNSHDNSFHNKSHKSYAPSVCVPGLCRQGRVEISERDINEACTSTCPSKKVVSIKYGCSFIDTCSQAGNTGLCAAPTASVIASFPVVRLSHTINFMMS